MQEWGYSFSCVHVMHGWPLTSSDCRALKLVSSKLMSCIRMLLVPTRSLLPRIWKCSIHTLIHCTCEGSPREKHWWDASYTSVTNCIFLLYFAMPSCQPICITIIINMNQQDQITIGICEIFGRWTRICRCQ